MYAFCKTNWGETPWPRHRFDTGMKTALDNARRDYYCQLKVTVTIIR